MHGRQARAVSGPAKEVGLRRLFACSSAPLSALLLSGTSSSCWAAFGGGLGLRLDLENGAMAHADHQGALSLGFIGLIVFAATTAIVHVRGRRRWTENDRRQKTKIADLILEKERAELILASEPQVLVTWSGKDAEPEIMGDALRLLGIPAPRRLLGFGSWLPPNEAHAVEQAVDALKARGERFSLIVKTNSERFVGVDGLAFAGRALMRVRDLTSDREARFRLEEVCRNLQREGLALRSLLDAIPQPLWLRGSDGRLTWVNAAYARALEAEDGAAAASAGLELLDSKTREEIAASRAKEAVYAARTNAIVAGHKLTFEVVDVPVGDGSGGIATDVTELETAREEVAREIQSHVRTLHQLPTAVAIFDRSKHLQFHNEAYRVLWQLDAAFLSGKPSDGEILDRLRGERRLPEQADFRGWKRTLLEGYQTLDTMEHWWYLPDGRTLRVVTNPNPQGGVTYLFDDVTERFHLESRFNSLSRVQGETLDTLKEAVAVFGSDGRLKLSNPAFQRIWGFPPVALEGEPHVDGLIRACGVPFSLSPIWTEIRRAVTGLQDARQPFQQRMERSDGLVIDCAAAPLPDGATLITFADVTDSVHAERMLKERNDALEAASQIKNNFVHTVSYELRTPLQNIVGFSEALASGAPGPLTEQQTEYLGHIASSSETLTALVEDILDLANIDAGSVELVFDTIDVGASIEAAIAGLRDRIETSGVKIDVRVWPDATRFVADGKRIRQILFNLIKNAIGYSTAGQTVTIESKAEDEHIALRVSDQGSGIPSDIIEKVFERFEAHTIGTRNKGVGLGLAIVRSFVELHGGIVALESVEGQGTTVICRFPITGKTPASVAA